jgi:polar amino acid transport system ATP-binding protein
MLLSCHNVSIRRGDRSLVSDATCEVGAGSIVAIMGESGTGKTTFLRAIAGLESPSSGSIATQGNVGMVFQFHHLFPHLTAVANVALAPMHVRRVDRTEAETRAQQLLDQLGVGQRAQAYPHELSGGEAQRVAIARALAMEPSLLLMDEPTASLDASRRTDLVVLLRGLASQGRGIVIATHDAEFARACADRTLVLVGGRLS